jgi:hypothetical protein
MLPGTVGPDAGNGNAMTDERRPQFAAEARTERKIKRYTGIFERVLSHNSAS